MKTYQGTRHGKAMMLDNGVVSWEYLTVAHGTSRMRSATRVMTEELSRGIRDFAILLNQVGSAAITLDLNETLLYSTSNGCAPVCYESDATNLRSPKGQGTSTMRY